MNCTPEITWSLMHPTTIDASYMRRVVEKASGYAVDSFEICGAFGSPAGGLNGLLRFEPYPHAAALCNQEGVTKTRATLSEMVSLAKAVHKPLYLWHREIMMPRGMLEDRPALIDQDGEFDLLGRDFEEFLRYKITNAFTVIPDLGGIVLTLTEADYSVIHNSDPDRYPPDKVVEKIVRIFAEEHERFGKRFILRSFGSIAADYEDILRGARAAAKEHHFDIETKITPYDFSPFLPTNPFLKEQPNTDLNAECDGLGEFMGAGYLPAANVDIIARYVRDGRAAGVKRYAIRLDRIGNSIFDSHEINLYAYQRLIQDPSCTADDIYHEWAATHWQGCEDEMIALSRMGLQAVLKSVFCCQNVVFHKFPILAEFKWICAGGSIGLYRNGMPMTQLRGCWGILSDRMAPGREAIRREKQEAMAMIQDGIKRVQALKGRLSDVEFSRLERVWRLLGIYATAVTAYTNCMAAFFDDMEEHQDNPHRLQAAVAEAERNITPLLSDASETLPTLVSCCDGAALPGDDMDRVCLKGCRFLCREMLKEYQAEFALRERVTRPDQCDLVLPGSFWDQCRIFRYMHASHSALVDSLPVRYAGNTVFPNGFIEVELECRAQGKILIATLPESAKEYKVTLQGTTRCVTPDAAGHVTLTAPTEGLNTLRIEKNGTDYPAILYIQSL